MHWHVLALLLPGTMVHCNALACTGPPVTGDYGALWCTDIYWPSCYQGLWCTVMHWYILALLLRETTVHRISTLWRSTCALCASPGYTRCFDRTSVYFCASPLHNLAVSQDFYSPLSLSLERSGWPRIWWCGIGGFQEQVKCLFVGLVALSFFSLLLFSLSLLFLYRLVVWGWGLRTDMVSISSRPCIENLF